MRPHRKPIVIASRRSPLARVQATAVADAIRRVDPAATVDHRWIESEGDRLSQSSLAELGGKGLFARAVEQALVDRRADVAVHSLKDLPAAGGIRGLVIAAVPKRADVRDCLISACATGLDDLPHRATLATASPRRASQAKRLRPDLQIRLIRGNVETRLRKVLSQRHHDATLLAVAGLRRAGLDEHVRYPIEPAVMLPAAGQGALAIQCRGDDHAVLCRCLPLNDALTAACVHAERRVVAALDGDCHSPIAVLANPTLSGISITARVLSRDGRHCLEAARCGPAKQIDRLAAQVARRLLDDGAKQLLAQQPSASHH